MRVGERLRGNPDDEEHESEREEPFDERVAALACEPTAKPGHGPTRRPR